ncbi:hypothetical protein PHACT_05025 [Pseudohongiella acticola]|jgi:hypothetical protein|uniref:Uncharacterized protein n=1 Tax=Pseudohongiella acticola TaxID=1524254 RepID=A0A1E8CJD4_9GAMM|nr:hypothetical protein [Pseudohongiella acticola]OFE12576.1 hypothetical protein PHACT_05025 [Pseudohongiella acticola]
MESKNKLWLGLGVVCVAGVAMTSCSSDESSDMAGMDHGAMTASEGGEGGEGASSADSVASDAVYLGQLAFIRGHLNVGVNLYREGDEDASATHMKHPESEIYAALQPALESRNAPGFADQLAALATAVENGEPVADVEAAYEALLQGITAAELAVSNQSARLLGDVIVDLVSTAAAEYDIAVGDDLSLENAHEYQDALGFIRIAYDMLDNVAALTNDTSAVASIRNQLDLVHPAWTGLQPPQRLHTEPSVIYGAASRIELAVSRL